MSKDEFPALVYSDWEKLNPLFYVIKVLGTVYKFGETKFFLLEKSLPLWMQQIQPVARESLEPGETPWKCNVQKHG